MIDSHPSEALIAQLDSADPFTSSRLSKRLLSYGSEAVPSLIEALRHTRLPRSWRAANILAQIDDPRWFVPMLRAVRAENPLLGDAAAKALAARYRREAATPLIAALPHCHSLVQLRIIGILEQLGATESVPQLIEMLARADSAILRAALLQALGKLGDPSLISLACLYLEDSDPHVRERARQCLMRWGAPA